MPSLTAQHIPWQCLPKSRGAARSSFKGGLQNEGGRRRRLSVSCPSCHLPHPPPPASVCKNRPHFASSTQFRFPTESLVSASCSGDVSCLCRALAKPFPLHPQEQWVIITEEAVSSLDGGTSISSKPLPVAMKPHLLCSSFLKAIRCPVEMLKEAAPVPHEAKQRCDTMLLPSRTMRVKTSQGPRPSLTTVRHCRLRKP